MSEIKPSSYWSFNDGTRVSIGKVHAMDPAELFAFLDWFALESYKRGLDDGEKNLAEERAVRESAVKLHLKDLDEAQKQLHEEQLKAYRDGRYQGQLEGHAEAFEQYQAQLKAKLDEHDCVEALNL